MKFRQYDLQEPEKKEESKVKKDSENNSDVNSVYDSISDLVQFEIEKMTFIKESILYFDENGYIKYKEFFEYILSLCLDTKKKLMEHLLTFFKKSPEFKIPAIDIEDIDDCKKLFEELDDYSNEFIERNSDALKTCVDEQDWFTWKLLMSLFDNCDHVCTKAVVAVTNGEDISKLIPCEQHSSEK